MISWNMLIGYIEKLQELPNGSGTEIEFTYKGIEYGICSYRDFCDIEKCSELPDPYGKYVFSDREEYRYQ